MKSIRYIALIATAVALNACSTTPVGMQYTAPSSSVSLKAAPVIGVGTVSDSRTNGPNWLGAIRGGSGNPLKTLETEKPVKDIVKDFLRQALDVNGLAAKGRGKYSLDVNIAEFNCNQYMSSEAKVTLNVSLIDNGSHLPVYDKTFNSIKAQENGLFDGGVFGSVEDLRKLANEALQDAIDQMLNDPDLRAKL